MNGEINVDHPILSLRRTPPEGVDEKEGKTGKIGQEAGEEEKEAGEDDRKAEAIEPGRRVGDEGDQPVAPQDGAPGPAEDKVAGHAAGQDLKEYEPSSDHARKLDQDHDLSAEESEH